MGIFNLFGIGGGSRNTAVLFSDAKLELKLSRSISTSFHKINSQKIQSDSAELQVVFSHLFPYFGAFRGYFENQAPTTPNVLRDLLPMLKNASVALQKFRVSLGSCRATIVKIQAAVKVLGKTDSRLKGEFEKNRFHRLLTAPITNERRLISDAIWQINYLSARLNKLEEKVRAEFALAEQMKAGIDSAVKGFASIKVPSGGVGNPAFFAQAVIPFTELKRAIPLFPKLMQGNAEIEALFKQVSDSLYSMQNTFAQLVIATR